MNQVKVWMQAVRPRTLLVTLSPVAIGAVVSLSWGVFDLFIFLVTLMTGLSIQIGANLANDYFDFKKGVDTAERKGPQRVMQAGLVTPNAMKKALILTFSITALGAAILAVQGGALILLLALVAILFAILYSGGPYPLASLGIADIFAFITFGPLATFFTYYLQTHLFSSDALFVGIGPGAFSWAILTINNLRDIDEDRIANKNTLCVRFGRAFGKGMYVSALMLAILIPFLWIESRPFLPLASLTLFLALPLAIQIIKNEKAADLNPLFQKTAQLLLVYTFLFSIGWML